MSYARSYARTIEHKMMEVANLIAATLEQPADPRAWEHLLVYCPRELLERRLQRLSEPTIEHIEIVNVPVKG